MVTSLWISKKKAQVLAFFQAIASPGIQFIIAESSRRGRTQNSPTRDPSREVFVRDKIYSPHAYHLVDEFSNGDESMSRKKKRVELGKAVSIDLGKRKMVASRVASSPWSGTWAVLMCGCHFGGEVP